MRIVAIIITIAILVLFFTGHWVLPLILYFIMGIAWVKHDSSRPAFYGRMGYSTVRGKIFLFLIWPLIVLYDCFESFQIIRRGERYIAFDRNGNTQEFSDWNKAIECARNSAKKSNQREMVSDQAIFTKQLGRMQHKSWMVNPDGTIEKLSRNLF